MCSRARWVIVLVAFVCFAWVKPAQAFTLIEDHFDVTISTAPSANPPITDVYFYRGYMDANGAPAGQLIAESDLGRGQDGILIGLLLPAVQDHLGEAYSLVGFCDGSVLVGMGDGSAASIVGNANFNFQSTFGVAESSMLSSLQAGDTNSIIAVLNNAYVSGLLPAVQLGAASPGTLLTFSTPANVGSISVVETPAPEPASVAMIAPLGVLLLRRRRGKSG